jgi:hypothetical protein
MQTEGAYTAEVMKLMECIGSKEDSLIQIVRTHQYHTISTLLQTVRDLKKIFSKLNKENKSIIAQNIKENGKRGYINTSHVAWTKNWWIRNIPISG